MDTYTRPVFNSTWLTSDFSHWFCLDSRDHELQPAAIKQTKETNFSLHKIWQLRNMKYYKEEKKLLEPLWTDCGFYSPVV